jgi:N-methylhydantoinase A/oxoprolinase/acetone carboxylase beta subunit
MRIDGPAIIEEKTSTTVVFIRQKAEVEEFLNLRIQLESSN